MPPLACDLPKRRPKAGRSPSSVMLSGMEAQATVDEDERRFHAGRWAVAVLVAAFLALLVYGLTTKGHDDRIDQALTSGRAATAPASTLKLSHLIASPRTSSIACCASSTVTSSEKAMMLPLWKRSVVGWPGAKLRGTAQK